MDNHLDLNVESNSTAIMNKSIFFQKGSMSTNTTLHSETEVFSTIGEALYLNPDEADVHFIFESDGERVPAHKIILSSGSEVFKTMFHGSLKEQGDIKIVDSTAEAFKAFLRFFYFNKVDVNVERVAEIMYLGRKYNVAECLRLCTKLLESNISDQTVITALDLAIFHEQQQLQKLCELFIASELDKVLDSENFLICDRRVLEHILKMDNLPCTETRLFKASMAWVKATSHEDNLTRDIVQAHLGNLFYKIRFGFMAFEEFAELLPVYGTLFSANEYNEILQVISELKKEPKLFNNSRRLAVWCDRGIIRCDRFLHCPWFEFFKMEIQEVTKFSTNASLLLGELYMTEIFDRDETPIRYIPDVAITIYVGTNILAQFTTNYSALSSFKIVLPVPILIKRGTIYEIRITIPAYEQRMTGLTFQSKVSLEHGIVVNFYDNERNASTKGVIRSLGFNLLTS